MGGSGSRGAGGCVGRRGQQEVGMARMCVLADEGVVSSGGRLMGEGADGAAAGGEVIGVEKSLLVRKK